MDRTDDSGARSAMPGLFLELAIVFVAYYVAGKLGQATTDIRSSNLGPVWPAYGVALAAVLRRPRVWPAIGASAFLVAYQSDVPHIAAVGQGVAATLAAVTGGFLLRRMAFDRQIARLRDALSFIVLGAGASTIVSSTLGVAVFYAAGVQAYSGIGPAWLVYWLGDSTGALLITPLALTGIRLLELKTTARYGEFAALILSLVLACVLIFGDLPLFSVRLHVLAFALLPFIIWAASRFGVAGVSLATVLIAAIATVATALGDGPFAQNSTFTNAVLLDVFFGVLAVSGLTLAAVIAERELAEAERERAIREQAIAEERLRLAASVAAEREHAAALVRESEDRLRLILDSAAQGIYGIDTGGHCTFCNEASARILGYESPEALLGKHMHALIHHSHADGTPVPLSECRVHEMLRTGQGVHTDSEVLWKADGTCFPAEYWAYPQRRGPDIVGAVISFTDITFQKRAEEKSQELREELAHLSRVGMLSALTGALAHEISQPLTAVRLNTEAALVLVGRQALSPTALREALTDIRNDNRRASDVLQNMRAMLRKGPARSEPVDINQSVGEVFKLIQSSAVRRGIRIDLALAPGARPVRGDRVQVQQVVLNLLMNACDAVEENTRPDRRVWLKTVTFDDRMVVEVKDCGAGLAEDDLTRIFEPFYTTKQEGMGLGLSICRAIVGAHGGTVEAARNPDAGMTFTAAFPLWQSASASEPLGRQASQGRS